MTENPGRPPVRALASARDTHSRTAMTSSLPVDRTNATPGMPAAICALLCKRLSRGCCSIGTEIARFVVPRWH